jgi:hypothetical protein
LREAKLHSVDLCNEFTWELWAIIRGQMRLSIIAITTLLISCSTNRFDSNVFADLGDKENVTIYLNDFKLDSVPSEIARLSKAKRLYVSVDKGGWTIYPPLSALPQPTETSLIPNLPNEITELTNLKSLSLVRLNLKSLPEDFDKFKNLDSLDLSMNRLTISNELEKLKKLNNLKYLALFGNIFNSADIEDLQKSNPGLTIKTRVE